MHERSKDHAGVRSDRRGWEMLWGECEASGRRALALMVVFSASIVASGCAQTVLFRTDRPGVNLIIDDEDKGEIPARGLLVSIPPGTDDVQYALKKTSGKGAGERSGEGEEVVERGLLEREVRWLPLITAFLGVAMLLPCCGLSCFALANPALVLGPGFLLAGTLAGFGTVLASPSWLSLPFLFAGSLVGLSPLALLGLSERVAPVFRVGVTPEGEHLRQHFRQQKQMKRQQKHEKKNRRDGKKNRKDRKKQRKKRKDKGSEEQKPRAGMAEKGLDPGTLVMAF